MCGRITQIRSMREYATGLGVSGQVAGLLDDQRIDNHNAGPGARHFVIRLAEDVGVLSEQLPWNWLSKWAAEQKMPPQINAKLEKLTGGFYRALMKTGRIVVPADGWFEWTADGREKQPWYIRPKDGKPLYLAAMTNVPAGGAAGKSDGFVIVTDASNGGMIDIHDRRPVVLSPEDALTWIDPSFDYKQADMLARERVLASNVFEWFRVSKDVNGHKYHDAHLIKPI